MLNSDIIRIEKANPEVGVFELAWKITYLCNYQCSFCLQGNPQLHMQRAEGECAETRMAVLPALVDFLEKLEGYSTVRISLVGGAVTRVKELPEILETLSACGFKGDMQLLVITNFSQTAASYCRLCDIVLTHDSTERRRRFHIRASFYKAYTTQEAFIEKLTHVSRHMRLTSVIASRKKGIVGESKPSSLQLASVYPVITDEDFRMFLEMKHDPRVSYVNINPIRILGADHSEESEAMKKFVEGDKVVKTHLKVTDRFGNVSFFESMNLLGLMIEDHDGFCPKCYICDAGVNSMVIDPYGNVKRCVAVPDREKTGNLIDGTFTRLSEPTICNWKRCNNSRFTLIEKAEE